MPFATMQPAPVVVNPRVFSPQSGQSCPVEDAIQSIIETSRVGIIWIVGGPGSGKTTALHHLEAVLPPSRSFRFVDDIDLGDARLTMEPETTVIASADTILAMAEIVLRSGTVLSLAPWTSDEWIEYLLRVHPKKCPGVMSRLHSVVSGDDPLDGNPELWRIALDRMATDDALIDVRSACKREIDHHIRGSEIRQVVEHYCFELLAGNAEKAEALLAELREQGCGDPIHRLLRHRILNVELAAARAIKLLGGTVDNARAVLACRLPRQVVECVAAGLTTTGIDRCESVVLNGPLGCQPMAASLLSAHTSRWKPVGEKAMNLSDACLADAQWKAVKLPNSVLSQC